MDALVDGYCARRGVDEVAVLDLVLPAGTRFCLDEDDIGYDPGGYPSVFAPAGLAPPELWRVLQRANNEIKRQPTPGYTYNHDAQDFWSCELAQMIDQRYLHKFNLRLFDPPCIVEITLEPC